MSDLKFVDAPYRLPSIVGKDVAELEEFTGLESRRRCMSRLRTFLGVARKSEEVCAAFIRAEWGEGKTSIYEGYLKKEEIVGADIVLNVSAGTIFSWLEDVVEGKYFNDTRINGLRLFGAILLSLSDVLRSKKEAITISGAYLPHPENFRSTLDFIDNWLSSFFENCPEDANLIIFIDEFEDLLHQPQRIRRLVESGLADILSGTPKELSKGGRFAGRVHFIISVTPAAFQAIHAELGPIFGRLGRRIEILDLRRLSREEGYKFVIGCLNYCYHGRMPKLPFTSSGLINTIYLASLGNPGAVVSILRKLLEKAAQAEQCPPGKLKVITPSDLLNYLRGEKLFVYGGQIPLLDDPYLNKIYSTLKPYADHRCLELLNTLLANTAPLNRKELMDTYGENSLETIREALDQIGIMCPFIRLKKVLSDYDEFVSKLEDSMEGIGLQKEDLEKTLSKLVDALTFYEYSDTEKTLKKITFLPADRLDHLEMIDKAEYKQVIEYLTAYVPELDENKLRVIMVRLHNSLQLSDDIYVMTSHRILQNLYPSPLIEFFDFIEKTDERFKVWIETRRRLIDYEEQFYKGIFRVINDGSKLISINIKHKRIGARTIVLCELKYKPAIGEEVSFYSYPLFSPDPARKYREKGYDSLIKEVEEADVPLLLIFSYRYPPNDFMTCLSTFTVDAVFEYLLFPLNMIRTQQIVAYILAIERGYSVNEEAWKAKAVEILEELRFDEQIAEWIRRGEKEGYTVRPPPKDLLGIRYLLNYPGREATAEELFEYTEELKKNFSILVRGFDFGAVPIDIESFNRFKALLEELEKGGFIECSEGYYRVVDTPVERRILKILNKLGEKKLSELSGLFVPSNADLRPYVKVMVEKGLIDFDKRYEYIKLVDKKSLMYMLKDFERQLMRIREDRKLMKGGYIASVKKRGYNVVILSHCCEVMEDILKELRDLKVRDPKLFRRRFMLLNRCLDYISSLIKELVKPAIKEIDEIISDSRVKVNGCLRSLKELKQNLISLGFPSEFIIKEEHLLVQSLKHMEELYERHLSRHECEEFIRDQWNQHKSRINLCPFYNIEPYYLNIKLFEIKEKKEKFNRLYDRISSLIREILGKSNELTKLASRMENHELFREEVETPLAKIILKRIKERISKNLPSDAYIGKRSNPDFREFDLEMIKTWLERMCKNLRKTNELLNELHREFLDINSTDKTFNDKVKQSENLLDVLQSFLDGESLGTLRNAFNNITERYQKLVERVKEAEVSDLHAIHIYKSSIDNLIRQLEDEVLSKLEKAFEDRIAVIRKLLTRLEVLLDATRRALKEHLSEDVRLEIERELKKICAGRDEIKRATPDSLYQLAKVGDIKGLYKRLLNDLDELISYSRNTIFKYGLLDEEELKIYEELRKLIGDRDEELENVLKTVSSKLNMRDEVVLEKIRSLNRKALVRIRIKAV